MELNKFADLTNDEFAAKYVNNRMIIEKSDDERNIFVFEGGVPASWDWRDHGAVTPVKD